MNLIFFGSYYPVQEAERLKIRDHVNELLTFMVK